MKVAAPKKYVSAPVLMLLLVCSMVFFRGASFYKVETHTRTPKHPSKKSTVRKKKTGKGSMNDNMDTMVSAYNNTNTEQRPRRAKKSKTRKGRKAHHYHDYAVFIVHYREYLLQLHCAYVLVAILYLVYTYTFLIHLASAESSFTLSLQIKQDTSSHEN